jgi:hypothetical protein
MLRKLQNALANSTALLNRAGLGYSARTNSPNSYPATPAAFVRVALAASNPSGSNGLRQLTNRRRACGMVSTLLLLLSAGPVAVRS